MKLFFQITAWFLLFLGLSLVIVAFSLPLEQRVAVYFFAFLLFALGYSTLYKLWDRENR